MKLLKQTIIQLFSYSFILFFSNCNNYKTVIEGTLPNDTYDSETVFWIPMEGEHLQPVDSTSITKNTFRLVISNHNLNKMGIVRVKPHLRFGLQDILVFTEAGTVKVKLDSISSSSGTPLNDIMQKWKERKRVCDMEVYALTSVIFQTETTDINAIEEDIKKIFAAYYEDVYRIIDENKNNGVGKFIYSIHRLFLKPEQIEALGITEDVMK